MKLRTYGVIYRPIYTPIYFLPRISLKKTRKLIREESIITHSIELELDSELLRFVAGITLTWNTKADTEIESPKRSPFIPFPPDSVIEAPQIGIQSERKEEWNKTHPHQICKG